MTRYERGSHHIKIHAVGTAPNAKPELHICKAGTDEAVAAVAVVELTDFTGTAQALYENELIANFGYKRGSKEFKAAVKKVRKALGYSYP